jgi:DNA-binding NtrC family response regulator
VASTKGRILIVCDDPQVSEELLIALKSANLRPERAADFTSACKLLKSGKFQVVFATPRVPGGSWDKLMNFARSRYQALPFVVVARSFDMSDWANCLKNGAFEVLDSVNEISKAAEIATQAVSASWKIAEHEPIPQAIVKLHDLSAIGVKHPEVRS